MRLCLLTLLLVACGAPSADDKTDTPTDTDGASGGDTDTTGGGGGGGDTDTTGGGGGGGGGDTDTTGGGGGGDTDAGGGDTDEDTDLPAPTIGLYAADYAVSGTRLDRIAVQDAHGNVALAWFHDTQLDVDCSVRTASDGALRCLPEVIPTGAGVSAGGFFGDAGCTTPVAVTSNLCGNSGYFGDSGDPETVSTFVGYYPTVYQKTARGCGGATLAQGTSAIGLSTVAPTTFVAFTRSGEAVDADLGVEVLTGDDGSRVVVGLWSVPDAQPAKVDSARAIPFQHDIPINQLIRSSCASGTFDAYMAGDPGFRPAWVVVTTYFISQPPIRELREIVSESPTWCRNGSTVSADPGSKVYVLGSGTAQWSDFPEVQGVTDTGSGQRFYHLVNAAGTPITPWPSSGAVQIYLNGVAGGIGRWEDRAAVLPASYSEPNYYSDSSCSQPVDSPLSGLSPGDVTLRREGADGVSCRQLRGAPELFDGVWTVPASTTGTNRTIFVSSGTCYEAGQDLVYTLTDASSSVSTLLPEPALASP